MKSYTNKAFTLVELIVVITILAILATVAFISFQGSTADAKNTKVTSDVANLAKKVTILNSQGTIFSKFMGSTGSSNTVSSLTIADGLSVGLTYEAGSMNFGVLQEDAASFVDSDNRAYFYAHAGTGSYSYFQVAGQTTNANGINTPLIKGNYSEIAAADSDSLFSRSGANVAVKSGVDFTGTQSMY